MPKRNTVFFKISKLVGVINQNIKLANFKRRYYVKAKVCLN